jgi:hypothetical protein
MALPNFLRPEPHGYLPESANAAGCPLIEARGWDILFSIQMQEFSIYLETWRLFFHFP